MSGASNNVLEILPAVLVRFVGEVEAKGAYVVEDFLDNGPIKA